MTSLTQTVASLNDALVPSLSFQLPKAASYVVSRQSQQVFPTGGSEFRPTGGTSLIRINLSTDAWWDPLTMRLRFKFTNNCNVGAPGQNPDTMSSGLNLLGPPGILFQRWRVLCGGTVLSDSGIYGAREYYMWYNLLRDPLRVVGDNIEAPWTHGDGQYNWGIYGVPDAPQNFRYFVIPLPCGIFNQSLYLHGTSAPLVLELMLNPDPTAPFMPQSDPNGDLITIPPNWSISEVSIVGDTIRLSSDFQNNFDSLLLAGSSIPYPFCSCFTQYQVVVPGTNSIQVIAQRAFSRVRAILVHFSGTPPVLADMPVKIRPYGTDSEGTRAAVSCKDVNYFCGPAGKDPSTFGDLLEAQLHVGGLVVPSLPQRGLSTQFMYLRQCVQQSYLGAMNISSLDEYGAVSYILGFQLERAPRDSSFSGISLMAGQTVTLVLNNILPPNGVNPDEIAENANGLISGVYLTFIYDSVLNVTGAGAELQM